LTDEQQRCSPKAPPPFGPGFFCYVFYAPIIDEQIDNGELVMPHHLDPPILQLLQQVAQENVKEAARR
jgi:hypothetical protein